MRAWERRLRKRIRASLIARDQRRDPRLQPRPEALLASGESWLSCCNICGWHGKKFASGYHSEGALCPHCGSIARDRYLFWCWTRRTTYDRSHRVLETSPRLDGRYRSRMAELVDYLCSDYDESAHRAMIKIDLQDIALSDASIDVILTPHVLEHVPNTDLALAEINRALKPGARMFLQIPMPQGTTAPPTVPEFHGDNTPVFWRFGWDLRDKLEKAGFIVTCLVTQGLIDRIESGPVTSGYQGPDIDEVDLLEAADPSTLTPIASVRAARRYGFMPDYHFITWECVKPAQETSDTR